MKHEKIVTQFLNQGFKDRDLVRLTLINGRTVIGRLNVAQVYCELNEDGEKINSRVGLLPPPLPPGLISKQMLTPFYSSDIVNIERA